MPDKDLMTKFEDLKNKKNYPYLSADLLKMYFIIMKKQANMKMVVFQ